MFVVVGDRLPYSYLAQCSRQPLRQFQNVTGCYCNLRYKIHKTTIKMCLFQTFQKHCSAITMYTVGVWPQQTILFQQPCFEGGGCRARG